MSGRTLRQVPRISYYEPEEPNLDEYVFCDKCGDYVYEYCSIHGALLVVPDDKVTNRSKYPPYVPRAALTIPRVFLHIAPSVIPGAGLGVFSTRTLPRGVRFGPYRGQRRDRVESMYCWQIYDKNNKPSHVIDAADGDKSNWMRYVNCARHWCEQNLVAYQYQGQLYYRTIKIIPRFTELMVFYGSEFANELDIDLCHYNSPVGYAQKFGAPVPKKRKYSEQKETKIQEIIPEKEVKDDKKPTNNVLCDISNKTKKQITNSKLVKSHNIKEKTKITLKDKEINNNKRAEIKTVSNEITKNNNKTNIQNANDIYVYCNKCNSKFINKNDLEKHSSKHDERRKFVCELCSLRFSSRINLTNHKLVKHNIENKDSKLFKCNFCEYKTYLKKCLDLHMRIHSNEKPFDCNICNKKINQKSHLVTHMRIHTMEKPFSCNICNKQFSEKSSLVKHMRIHTMEKPFICNICNKKFNQKSNLVKHTRIHTGEKPYKCDICDYKCNQSSSLKYHLQSKHL